MQSIASRSTRGSTHAFFSSLFKILGFRRAAFDRGAQGIENAFRHWRAGVKSSGRTLQSRGLPFSRGEAHPDGRRNCPRVRRSPSRPLAGGHADRLEPVSEAGVSVFNAPKNTPGEALRAVRTCVIGVDEKRTGGAAPVGNQRSESRRSRAIESRPDDSADRARFCEKLTLGPFWRMAVTMR